MTTPAADDARPAAAGRWLALETAGLYGSIAAAEVSYSECRVLAAERLPTGARSAQTLAPAVDAMLKRLGWAPDGLATVAVAVGPGSFTGLRVGVVTAKTLAFATGAAVVAVDTLDVLAEGAEPPVGSDGALWTAVDAQRGERFAARYEAKEGAWCPAEPTHRLTRDELEAIAAGGSRVVGPGVDPSAEHVLAVARRRWLAGEVDSVLGLAPRYHRLSAAEEKLSES